MIAPLVSADPAKQAVLQRVHAACGVHTRHLVMPLEKYQDAHTFGQSNEMFVTAATDLAEQALRQALTRAGLRPADIDYVMFTSVTGVSAPSVDAALVARMGLRSDVKRVPMYGLGCVAGAAGIARVNDYLIGHPTEVAALLSVELCSLTFQRDDDSMANLVASGLFGDGAAAVVLVGSAREDLLMASGPEVLDTRSRLYPDTDGVIGFTLGETGFSVVLTAQVAGLVERHFGADVHGFLADNGLTVGQIDSWIAHPGGPRVLEAFHSSLGLGDGMLDISWRSLAAVGNLSSASVLHILAEMLDAPPSEGTTVLFALGPGVATELVLLRWPGLRP